MEAHGSPAAKVAQKVTGLLPDALAAKLMERAGVDRLAALYLAIDAVRRGGTISLIGVYGGADRPAADDARCSTSRSSCAWARPTSRRWVPDILPLLLDGDPLGVDDFATHHLPLDEAPDGLRDVPEEGGRRRQGAAPALTVTARRRAQRADAGGAGRGGRRLPQLPPLGRRDADRLRRGAAATRR